MDVESRPRSHSASESLSEPPASETSASPPEPEEPEAMARNEFGPQGGNGQGSTGDIEIKVPTIQQEKLQVCCRRCLSITRSRLFGTWALGRWSAVFQVAGLLITIVAFSSPYWEDWPDEYGDLYSGLWTVCVFNKCGSLLERDIKAWLVAVQVLMSLSLVIQFKALVFMLLHLCFTSLYPHRRVLTAINITFNAQAIVISVTSLLLYGAKQGFLSGTLAWAYIIAWLAPVFLIMALICSCFLLKSQSARTHGDKRPILQHSISVDSSHLSPAMCMRSMKKSSPRPISPVTTRERSGSELRARATSVTALMQNTPPERCPDRCDATHAM